MPERMAGSVRSLTVSAMRNGPSIEKASKLIRHVDLLIDAEHRAIRNTATAALECRPGCDACCYQVIYAGPAELAGALDYIRKNFTEAQIEDLKRRVADYRRIVAPSYGFGLEALRPQCPLLVDGLCSIYDARPLNCRGRWSTDRAYCEMLKHYPESNVPIPTVSALGEAVASAVWGIGMGLSDSNVKYASYDFGLALGILLDHPDALERSFSGTGPLIEAVAQLVPQDPPVEFPEYRPGQEPTGILPPSGHRFAFIARRLNDLDKAFSVLEGAHPINGLRRIAVPSIYRSEDEIQVWRERFRRAMRAFFDSKFDPRKAFDALMQFTTFELAYQGKNDRELLSELGDLLVDRITKAVLPDLCEPIDERRNGKFKVGYIGYNLRNSNGANWALGWLRNHAEDIETYAFCLAAQTDEVSDKFRQSADHYYNLLGPVPEAARLIKNLGLDVLIYPEIGMGVRNYQFATMRLAPVQCAAWGHPVTSGLPTIDYYLSSELMEPPNGQDHYREKLIRLPGSGLCLPQPENVTPPVRTKAYFGLDDGPLILCSQFMLKLLPQWDFLFREISERTGRPIVFLRGIYQNPAQILHERLQIAGVEFNILPCLDRNDYMSLLSLADISLDTPGWSGGNTTIDALSLGIPVVTLPGELMRGRHTLAFLEQVSVPDLIVSSHEQYVDLACNLQASKDSMRECNAPALFGDLAPVCSLDDLIRNSRI